MKPTLSECLREHAESILKCEADASQEIIPQKVDARMLHEAADALDAASGKPAAYYGGVPIYESDDPFLKGKGLVAAQQPACSHAWGRPFLGMDPASDALFRVRCRKCGEVRVDEPAAERADEGLDSEATLRAEGEKLWYAAFPKGSTHVASFTQLARAARALRRGGDTPPTVAVTDVERAAMTVVNKFGLGDGSLASEQFTSEEIAAILRDCTRAASVEEVARTVYAEMCERRNPDAPSWETNTEANRDEWRGAAREALRVIGAREAEKNATPPPAPAQAGWTWTDADDVDAKAFRDLGEQARSDLCAIGVMAIGAMGDDAPDGGREHDALMGRFLYTVRRVAPHFHKVRVKLPEKRSTAETAGDVAYDDGFNRARAACAAALRDQGVEVSEFRALAQAQEN